MLVDGGAPHVLVLQFGGVYLARDREQVLGEGLDGGAPLLHQPCAQVQGHGVAGDTVGQGLYLAVVVGGRREAALSIEEFLLPLHRQAFHLHQPDGLIAALGARGEHHEEGHGLGQIVEDAAIFAVVEVGVVVVKHQNKALVHIAHGVDTYLGLLEGAQPPLLLGKVAIVAEGHDFGRQAQVVVVTAQLVRIQVPQAFLLHVAAHYFGLADAALAMHDHDFLALAVVLLDLGQFRLSPYEVGVGLAHAFLLADAYHGSAVLGLYAV